MKKWIIAVLLGSFVAAGTSIATLADDYKKKPLKKPLKKSVSSYLATVDKPAPNFKLMDNKGNEVELSDFAGNYVVLEWTNPDCPFVKKHYKSGNMQKLQREYTKKGAVWLRICSSGKGKQGYYNGEAISSRVKVEKAMQTAYLIDADGRVGRLYGAKTTPHMFVIDPEQVLIYAGGIDDKPSTKASDIKSSTNYVAACLDAAMTDKPIAVKTSKPYGCSVKYADKNVKKISG